MTSTKARRARRIILPGRAQDGSLINRRITAKVQADVDGVSGDVSTLEGRVTVAEGEIDQLEIDVPALDGRVTQNETDIGTLQGQVTALEALHQVLTADPGTPADDTWWLVRSGTTPGSTVELRVRINGATYTVAGIAI